MKYAARTHAGRVRRHNEDAFACDRERGLFAVSDGARGYARGTVRSRYAVDTAVKRLSRALDPAAIDTLGQHGFDAPVSAARLDALRSLADAARAVHTATRRENAKMAVDGAYGMTLIAALVTANRLYYVHVGDSRIYVIGSGREITQVTSDQTLGRELLEGGVPLTLIDSPLHLVLNHWIGVAEDFAPEPGIWSLDPDDTVLICSNGLNGHGVRPGDCGDGHNRGRRP